MGWTIDTIAGNDIVGVEHLSSRRTPLIATETIIYCLLSIVDKDVVVASIKASGAAMRPVVHHAYSIISKHVIRYPSIACLVVVLQARITSPGHYIVVDLTIHGRNINTMHLVARR